MTTHHRTAAQARTSMLQQRVAQRACQSAALVRRSIAMISLSGRSPDQRLLSETTDVRIRNIRAHCACGSEQFLALHPPPHRIEDAFMCARCARLAGYGDLLDQIGEEAMRRARVSIQKLKQERSVGKR